MSTAPFPPVRIGQGYDVHAFGEGDHIMLGGVNVHLVDGTYELFRHFFALPSAKNAAGEEVAAVRGVMHSIRGLVAEGATNSEIARTLRISEKTVRNQVCTIADKLGVRGRVGITIRSRGGGSGAGECPPSPGPPR